MSRSSILLFAVVLSGCASTQGAPGAQPPVEISATTQRIQSAMDNTKIIGGAVANQVAVGVNVAAPATDVWTALQAVYAELKVPEGTLETSSRTIGNQQFRVRRKFAGESMMKWVDCGSGSGGPNAETYDIQLSVVSYVAVVGAKESTLTTRVSGQGSDPAFGRGNSTVCNTQGELEKRIELMVKAKLGLK